MTMDDAAKAFTTILEIMCTQDATIKALSERVVRAETDIHDMKIKFHKAMTRSADE